MTGRAVLAGRDVAALLGRAPGWFYRNRAHLQARHAFPGPLPGLGRPTWARAAVEQWLADPEGVKAMGAAAAAGKPLPPRVAAAMEADLARRAAALAGP